MNTTQTNTALPLVTALYNAIDSHQAIIDQLNPSYEGRAAALKALKDAGFTAVQDGRAKGAAKANEIPYNTELKAFFVARFEQTYKTTQVKIADSLVLAGKLPEPYQQPGKKQIENALIQGIRSLNHYLKEGVFVTNVGRDRTKNELLELASQLHAAERKELAAKEKADRAKAALAKAALVEARQKELATLDAAESEAERLLIEEIALMAAEAAAANPTEENKLALDIANAEKLAIDKLAADKLAADKLAADSLAADKVEAAKLAAVAKVEADKATVEKVAAQTALDTKKKPVTAKVQGVANKISFKAMISPDFVDQAKLEMEKLEHLPIAVRVSMARQWLSLFETAE